MKGPVTAQLHQIHLGIGPNGYESVTNFSANDSAYQREHDRLETYLLDACPPHLWPKGSYNTACPRPILIGNHHKQQLVELHVALNAAITDIVQRWWTDDEARFSERMPLEKEEEDLLQWLEGQVECGNLQTYSACRGSWRPDFLVEDQRSHQQEQGMELENFRITEINARFSFNGFMHVAYGQQALDDIEKSVNGLSSATNIDEVLNGLFSLFDLTVPLHLLKGEEQGIDIYMFVDAVQRRFGITPRVIHPNDLRLLPDSDCKNGYRLCCIAKDMQNLVARVSQEGEIVEEIHQVGLELHQQELLALDTEVLRQISLRCFNDMRTILLVHDKRMLGIVKQELQLLVARQVLTPAQAMALDQGVADTILPSSWELDRLLQISTESPSLRNEHILKPVRSGKGSGIVFGEDLTPDEWLSALRRLQSPSLASKMSYVVQRRIIPRLYDVVLEASGHRLQYPLVGTYHAVHGNFLGLGIWRSSGDRICAVSRGGSWLCSVIRREEQC